MPKARTWPEYKVEKWWELNEKTGKRRAYFVPHYLDFTETGLKWRPYTFIVKNRFGRDTMKVRRYSTRLEADTFIEMMIYTKKKKEEQSNGVLPDRGLSSTNGDHQS